MVGSSMRSSVPVPSDDTSRTVPIVSTSPVNMDLLLDYGFVRGRSGFRLGFRAKAPHQHRAQREDDGVAPKDQQGRQRVEHHEDDAGQEHLNQPADTLLAMEDLAR